MRRHQTFHETLIPLLVEGLGCQRYLEFGTHMGETIGRVKATVRVGVDSNKPSNGLWDHYEMPTAEFIATFAAPLGPFDFVFIDADHSYAAAKADFLGIWPHVAIDGLICLHDTNPETEADTAPGLCGDSYRMVAWLYDNGYEAVTLPYHPGLTIVRKYE